MSRIQSREDFIKKANEIFGNKYDYSLVDYKKSSIKVEIICPEHGVFVKTPNKHLQGQGCPVCGRNRTRLSKSDFVQRSSILHNNYYDYSKVNYVNNHTPVEIICPVHGTFKQTPHSHLILKHGCPKCGQKKAGKKRSGQNSVAHKQSVKEKKKQTCLERYGATTWAGSEEGRKRLHEIIIDEDKLSKMKQTCQEKYGADFWIQSDEGKEQFIELMNSDEMQDKIKNGYMQKYGKHYMQTDEGRAKAKSYIDDKRRKKMRESMIRLYGVPYAGMHEMFKQKSINTNIERYGVPYASMCKEIQAKINTTKRKNGTFNVSNPEKTLEKLLIDYFGKDDVVSQYKEKRYPFHCDFYIKSLDLFIELNAHWSHGGHWFDETNEEDIQTLKVWQEKSKKKGSRYYHSAIKVWTERDLMKRDTAINNNINYLVFWKSDLSDARDWLQSNFESRS